jgi:glyoxalase family protein
MPLEALHHVTMVTADARANVAFYAELLGLRLVKKTVNFDAPQTYHLYYGDERGSPGSILTWFEFPHARQGRPGAGMVHRLELGVADEAALAFWKDRLDRDGHRAQEVDGRLRFRDYDGLEFDLVAARDGNPPLRAEHPDIPAEHALLGVEGARAYADDPSPEHPLLTQVLGFKALDGGEFRLDGSERHVHWAYDAPPPEPGRGGGAS